MPKKTVNKQGLFLALAASAIIITAGGIAFFGIGRNVNFYISPSELLSEGHVKQVRLGGVIVKGSLIRSTSDGSVSFLLEDYSADVEEKKTVPVEYKGRIPDLFIEESLGVAEGAIQSNGIFLASKLMAKHDENYTPPAFTSDK